MKIVKRELIKFTLTVKTGLHIGGNKETYGIGGIDSPVIKDPITNEPIIPGSSIKGKMRSIMEWKLDKINKGNNNPKDLGKPCPCGKPECQVCRVFGSANNSKSEEVKGRGPTRLIVRDAVLSEDWKKKFDEGKSIVEEKNENSLNRITAEATPRPIERVVPGVEFNFEISYRVIDTGDNGSTDEKNFDEVVLESLKLLQNDYLGGGGSRGNGQIEFKDLVDEKNNPITL